MHCVSSYIYTSDESRADFETQNCTRDRFLCLKCVICSAVEKITHCRRESNTKNKNAVKREFPVNYYYVSFGYVVMVLLYLGQTLIK